VLIHEHAVISAFGGSKWKSFAPLGKA